MVWSALGVVLVIVVLDRLLWAWFKPAAQRG